MEPKTTRAEQKTTTAELTDRVEQKTTTAEQTELKTTGAEDHHSGIVEVKNGLCGHNREAEISQTSAIAVIGQAESSQIVYFAWTGH